MKLEKYPYVQAKHHSNRKGQEPSIIVLHYTAGRGDAERTASFFKGGSRKASAHFCISRKPSEDGTQVVQCVDTDDSAWHAGTSKFCNHEGSVNRQSIGLEVCNAGWAHIDKLPEDRIFEGRHRNPASRKDKWEKFSEEQYQAVEQLCKELKELHPTLQYVTTHEDIRNKDVVNIKGAKTDPGPAWDYSKICWDSLGLEEWHWSFKRKIWYTGNATD